MRIVCEKCQAAYAIDDRLISPRGVRAQCPRCRHLQLVTRDAPPVPPPLSPRPPDPNVTPVATPRVPPEAYRQGPSPAPPRAPATPAAPPAPPPVPPAEKPQERPLWDALPPPPPPVAKKNADDLWDRPTQPAVVPEPPKPAIVGCRECNKPLDDPFDQALGICDACRAKSEPAPELAAEPRSRSGRAPTLGAEPVSRSGVAPSLGAEPKSCAGAAPSLGAEPKSRAGVISAARPGAAVPPKERPRAPLLVAVAVLVLALAGAGAYLYRDRLFGSARKAAQAKPPPEIDAAVAAWRMGFVDLAGSADELVKKGEALLRDDLTASYDEAAESFQKALVLDPGRDDAVAGYVKALALGRGQAMSDAEYEQAVSLVRAAEARSKKAPAVQLARAHLLLARPQQPGNPEAARGLAEGVLEKTQDARTKADAYLVVGRSWQQTSGALAVGAFSNALELDPELKVALFLRALAYEGAGDYTAAIDDLHQRLKLDPNHWNSNAELAHIFRAAGQPDRAHQLFEKILKERPDDARARLELAVLQYQAEARLTEALAGLRAMAKERDRYDDAVQFRIFTHLATAERLAGNQNAAVDAANTAVKLNRESAAPHLQLFLIASERGLPADAAKAFAGFDGKTGEPAIEKLLLGRLRMMESRWADAEEAFAECAKLDSLRTDAKLLAGQAAAHAKSRDAAYRHLLEAASSDPLRPSPPPRSELLFFRPVVLLKGADDAIPALGKGADDLLPKVYEAVFRYHLGEDGVAARNLAQVVAVDQENALAQAWRAFVALRQKDVKTARAAGQSAVAAGRTLALAHYALGAALEAQNDAEGARRELLEALQNDRSLLGAEFLLAKLESKKDPSSARERLTRVVTLDPSFQPARELLFSLRKGEHP